MTQVGKWNDGVSVWDSTFTWDVASATDTFWEMSIDIAGDGTFSTNIAAYATDFYCSRGRTNLINASADGLERMQTGEAVITLDNSDGRFDAYNTSSPYYPALAPGILIKIRTWNTSAWYDVFAGLIYDIQLEPDGRENYAVITVRDGMHYLNETPSSTAIELSKQVSAAVTDILADIGYPAELGTDINLSSDYINTYWSTDDTAAVVIHELAELELGQYYIASDGKFTFQGRHTNNASAATLSQANLLQDISRPQPWEVNKNLIRTFVNQVVATANAEIYNLSVPLYIDAGDSITIFAKYFYLAKQAYAEDIVITFSANSNSDGTGTDLTANFTVTDTEFSNAAKLVCANTGASGGYITITITGTACVQSDPFYVEAGTGKRLFSLNSDYTQDKLKADEYSTFLLAQLNTNQTTPVFMIEAYHTIQFAQELQSVITVNIPYLNISNVKYRIGAIEHQWLSDTGRASRTKIYTEPFLDPGAADTFNFTFPVTLSL